uniref:RNA-directed DNA polymerase n=1 Tax=Lygus hesperus TaxID=30085 RepID=A0A0A9X1Z8_LYGHE
MDGENENTLVGELIKALKYRSTAHQPVELPIFNPEKNDSAKWLDQVDKLRTEFQWTDNVVFASIGKFLLRSSRIWFENWTPDFRDWDHFARDFKEAFPFRRNLGKLLEEAAFFTSLRTNTYETYVHEKLSYLRSLRANWSDCDLIELTVHGISEQDVRSACTLRNCQTIPELLTFLSEFPTPNRSLQASHSSNITLGASNSSTSMNPRTPEFLKRKRTDADERMPRQCHRCGMLGHIRRFCPLLRKTGTDMPSDHVPGTSPNLPYNFNVPSQGHTSPPALPKPTSSAHSKPDSNVPCEFCLKLGHGIESCYLKASIEKRRQIRLVAIGPSESSVPILVDGKPFSCLIDSGADISLMSDRFLPVFQHKIEKCHSVIRGIVPGQLVSEWSCTVQVDVMKVAFGLRLFFVSDSILDYDVLLGRDIYEDPSIMTITDHTGSKIIRKSSTTINRVTTSDLPVIENLSVPDEHRQAVVSLLSRFPNMITSGTRVRCVNNSSLSINLEREVVINRHPYRLSHDERSAVRDIISDLLANGIIRESDSPFASPITLVRKKDGSYRMCVDYRELNRFTVKDRYPLPLIDDQLDRLGNNNSFFTSLDMASGFFQIPMAEDSISKTAFVTPDGHFEYLRVPFGLANAPAAFQRAVNKALGPLRHSIVVVYLDDLLLPSKTPQEGLENLQQVLEALNTAGFSLNIKKCKFLQPLVEYLGREVSAEGIRPGSQKIEALQKSPIPSSVKQVRQFMGLANYFRKFIPEFAARTACITDLTKKDHPFLWSQEHDVARDYVITCLSSRPLLAVFDHNLPTELHTDASSLGYGAILLQMHDGKKPRVVAYFSRRTTKDEEHYHSYELETLAIVNALRHFRVYLLGIQFKLVTDCNAVKATATKKDIIPRVARWWMYMQDFNFEIVYRKGSDLSHVDFLSRNPPSSANVLRVRHDTWLYIEQKGNIEVQKMLSALREGKLDPNQYAEKDGLLYYKLQGSDGSVSLRWFVPRQSRLGLLRIFHDEQCHIGPDKTLSSIAAHFWFPRMRSCVLKYVKHCLICAVHKTRTGPRQGFIFPIEKPSTPFHTLHGDCLGPLPTTSEGFKHLLIIVDAFTKYCLLLPLCSTSAAETEKQFLRVIGLFGTPKFFVTDAGSNFKNTTFPKLLETLKIEHHCVTPDVHRGNGQVERYMRTLMNLIRVESTVSSEWSRNLWKIQLVLNSTLQKSTGTTPLQLLIGVNTSTPLLQSLLRNLDSDLSTVRNRRLDRERVARLMNSAQDSSDVNSKRRDTQEFAVGNFVLMHKDKTLHNSKLNYTFLGPYEVISCLPRGRYGLKKVGTRFVTKAAKEQLRRWPTDWSLMCDIGDLLDSMQDEEGTTPEVDSIDSSTPQLPEDLPSQVGPNETSELAVADGTMLLSDEPGPSSSPLFYGFE